MIVSPSLTSVYVELIKQHEKTGTVLGERCFGNVIYFPLFSREGLVVLYPPNP